MNEIASRINTAGTVSSIAGVVALISYYGFKTAREVSSVFLATENRDLFGQIAEWSSVAGFGLFGLGLVLAGSTAIMRRDELEKKDLILGLGVPVLGLAALALNVFVL